MKPSGHFNNGNGRILPGHVKNFMIIAGKQPVPKTNSS